VLQTRRSFTSFGERWPARAMGQGAGQSIGCCALCFHRPVRLVSAVVALKNANFGAIPLNWIGRAPSQMCVAAAFAAADRPNEFLILDDEGTPFHCPPPTTNIPNIIQSCKTHGIATNLPGAVENCNPI
jgi:hypothetical protein